ncbi:MAG: hypothetical protein A4E65_02339 [Syntrophorhabdus sp. PtaU1.Bin153]|nr:MAG: hypothetical protein A4E65_02339 [Syntrophorhabdus sp. PtaU1.Bin153]
MARYQIINAAKTLLAEIKQIFLDADHWNNIHPNEEPINPDEDGFLHHIAEILEGVVKREADRP